MRRIFGLSQHDLTGTARSILTPIAQKISTGFKVSGLGVLLITAVPTVTLSGCGMFSGGGEGNYPPSKAERRRDGGTIFGGDDSDEGGLVIFGDGGIFGSRSGQTEQEQAPAAVPDDDDRGFLGGVLGGSSKSSTPKLGVNSYLWRASLDTVSFMPLKSADPFGGVIITDWYADPKSPGERFKLTVYILDTSLRADGVRVTAFRQTADGRGGWSDAAVSPRIAPSLENAILLRARELRIGTGS
ncbi:MAG: DUF3576 domain-containing protein [Alphaproteobacteria bacterium]